MRNGPELGEVLEEILGKCNWPCQRRVVASDEKLANKSISGSSSSSARASFKVISG